MQYIYARRLHDVERMLAPLLAEKFLLEKADAGSKNEWFQSDVPVKTSPVVETATTNQGWSVWLNLGNKQLNWSRGMPGKDGYLYYEKVGSSWKPYWEFSLCDVTNIDDLAGKPLKARFAGLFSPGTSGQSLRVSIGQVLLVRTVDDPKNIFVLQIIKQELDQDKMTARYALLEP